MRRLRIERLGGQGRKHTHAAATAIVALVVLGLVGVGLTGAVASPGDGVVEKNTGLDGVDQTAVQDSLEGVSLADSSDGPVEDPHANDTDGDTVDSQAGMSGVLGGMMTASSAPSTQPPGAGTADDPYEITTWEQLSYTSEEPGAVYELHADLDASTAGYSDVVDTSNGWHPVDLTGTFDGQGHEIADLVVDRSWTSNVGLFGTVSGVVEDVRVANADVTGAGSVGAVVGYNQGSVTGVTAADSTVYAASDRHAGGVVGLNSGDLQESSAVDNHVESEDWRVGGLVGTNQGYVGQSAAEGNSMTTPDISVGGLIGGLFGTVEQSYAIGNTVEAERSPSNAGGLVGWHGSGTIQENFAADNVLKGSGTLGGLVGRGFGTNVDSYWDIETTVDGSGDAVTRSSGGTGLTTDEMQGDDNGLDGFDDDTWVFVGDAYPELEVLDDPEVTTVEIEPEGPVTATAGDEVAFSATALDEFGDVVETSDAAFDWDAAGGSISGNGLFAETEADEDGTTYEVTASFEGVTADATAVTVEPAAVDELEVEPGTDQQMTAGDEIEFSATALDEFGNVNESSDAAFDWSAEDGSIAGDGVFDETAAAESGTTYDVTAALDGVVSDATSVTVEPAPVDSVSIDPAEDQAIWPGDEIEFSATAVDEFGNVNESSDAAFDWNGEDGSIADDGVFDESVPGTYTVTAELAGVASPSTVVMVMQPLEVDVKPSEDHSPTPINPDSNGVTPVGIMSTDEFDATEDLDVDTLRFGPPDVVEAGEGAAPAHDHGGHEMDIDGNGEDDLLVHFDTSDAGFSDGDEVAMVAGERPDGVHAEGTDSVTMVGGGPPGNGPPGNGPAAGTPAGSTDDDADGPVARS